MSYAPGAPAAVWAAAIDPGAKWTLATCWSKADHETQRDPCPTTIWFPPREYPEGHPKAGERMPAALSRDTAVSERTGASIDAIKKHWTKLGKLGLASVSGRCVDLGTPSSVFDCAVSTEEPGPRTSVLDQRNTVPSNQYPPVPSSPHSPGEEARDPAATPHPCTCPTTPPGLYSGAPRLTARPGCPQHDPPCELCGNTGVACPRRTCGPQREHPWPPIDPEDERAVDQLVLDKSRSSTGSKRPIPTTSGEPAEQTPNPGQRREHHDKPNTQHQKHGRCEGQDRRPQTGRQPGHVGAALQGQLEGPAVLQIDEGDGGPGLGRGAPRIDVGPRPAGGVDATAPRRQPRRGQPGPADACLVKGDANDLEQRLAAASQAAAMALNWPKWRETMTEARLDLDLDDDLLVAVVEYWAKAPRGGDKPSMNQLWWSTNRAWIRKAAGFDEVRRKPKSTTEHNHDLLSGALRRVS